MNNTFGYILSSMRVSQWIKNLFIFAALIFSANLFNTTDLLLTVEGFFAFSLSASAVYLFNDIFDRSNDQLHPIKSKRPLPSGKLSVTPAAIAAFALAGIGLVWAFALSLWFGVTVAVYILINLWYTTKLKSVVILDVMTISAGFVLRVIGGALLINVPTSEWLIICTILLSLFLGFSKRRHEISLLENQATTHRSVLQHYSLYFLDQMIGIVTASTVMSYALYTISEETVRKFGTSHLIYTVPFVLYGIFRYLYLIHKKEEGGNPTKLALTDKPLLLNIILWFIVVTIIVYGR
jgi:4-hydroxybenzoate polyprenyltransferase